MLEAGEYGAVVVIGTEGQQVLGALMRDAVMRLSPRLPEAPVRLLPLQRVGSMATLDRQSAETMLDQGELGLVVIGEETESCWSVLLAS